MKAVIVEDERLSADRLRSLVQKVSPDIEVLEILDSVGTARDWLSANSQPDVMFLDIQLNDGTSFDLLSEGLISCPVIFTTAYDQFAVKAFKFNSVDYLLKPVESTELEKAIEKFQRNREATSIDLSRLSKMVTGDYKKRFLVKLGEKFQSVEIGEVAYFYYDEGITFLMTKAGKKWPIDLSIESLEGVLNPLEFFRINRKLIICLPAISEIHTYFNGRLLLKLNPTTTFETIVSRERVSDFKKWMDL